ncbi:MAG: hypothetical protein Q7J57_09960 [Gemmobacter sp.]|nr:hypothetical protein [Gemmobacter sp.]
MKTLSHMRLTLICLALGSVVSGPVHAQARAIPDLWSIPNAPAQPLQGDTPQLDLLPIDKTRMEMDIALRTFGAAGHLKPLIPELDAYSDDTLRGLSARVGEGGDPCTQAVRSALYLDAHLEEADWTQRWEGYERKGDIFAKVGTDIIIPDTADRLALVIPQFKYVSAGLKAYTAYETAQSHYAQTAAVRNGIAINEIVEQSLNSNWSEADIQKKRAALLNEAQSASERMLEAQLTIEKSMKEVDNRYDATLKAAFEEAKRGYERLYDPVPDSVLWDRIALTMPNLIVAYDQAKYAAAAQRVKDHQKAMDDAYDLMNETQFATDKALTQFDALARYAAPLARGDCSTIKRDGPVPAAKSKADPVGQTLRLPNDKLMIFLESIGISPSQDLMNCVCRSAGYGSSGTSQYYHPDTIGTYDKRYSCQHPGPPCIVSGFGCSRHPLPSDPKIWVNCGKSTGEDIPAAIADAVKLRQQKK